MTAGTASHQDLVNWGDSIHQDESPKGGKGCVTEAAGQVGAPLGPRRQPSPAPVCPALRPSSDEPAEILKSWNASSSL